MKSSAYPCSQESLEISNKSTPARDSNSKKDKYHMSLDSIQTANNSSPLSTVPIEKVNKETRYNPTNLKVIQEEKEPIDPIYDGIYMNILKREPITPRSVGLCNSNDTEINSLRDNDRGGKNLSSKNSIARSHCH